MINYTDFLTLQSLVKVCFFFISNIYQYTCHVCCSNIKKAKDETKKLETESKKMEDKLKELRMAMSREKEEREYV